MRGGEGRESATFRPPSSFPSRGGVRGELVGQRGGLMGLMGLGGRGGLTRGRGGVSSQFSHRTGFFCVCLFS